MIDENDFRNFEATIYWKRIGKWKEQKDGFKKCEGSGKPDQMTIYGRGGLHGSGWPNGCLGCCYKGSFDYNIFKKHGKKLKPGSSDFEKEYHHYNASEGYAERILQEQSKFTFSDSDNDDLDEKWVGLKLFVFDTNEKVENEIYVARCEIWVDKNAEQSINDPSKQNWQ